ncbi:MAG: hypothetical protein U5R46_12585 [Gammaproteobacteria bacterium]|nr:hypothetical protein [Gammaproteobacteria bacterium]
MQHPTDANLSTDVQPAPPRSVAGASLIDTGRYPLHTRGAPAYADLLRDCRRQIDADGCILLPGFVRPETVERMRHETEALAPSAHFNDTCTNPYNSADDPALAADHPKRLFQDRSNGFVAGDRIADDTCIRNLYHDAGLQSFLADVLGVEQIYEYADPLAGLVVNVLRPGCQHPWHFDTNEFVVSMMTKQPAAGGAFEYCPGIRAPGSENYDAVRDVVQGDRARVRVLDLKPGDLQIFFGRFALHRVTRPRGSGERHTLILGYAREPGLIGRAERTRKLFGRLADVHRRQRDAAPARGDTLSD